MEHIEIEVLETSGTTRDCTVGKVYKALSTVQGMKTIDSVVIDSDGATFFDDIGEQCECLFSKGQIKLVQREQVL